MSVTINGDTGIDKVQDGSIVAADLASTLDLSGKTITLATDAVDQLSTASGSAPSYSARLWVNFNGTGTIAIRNSGNVSSLTDNGTGDHTVNFTTALSASTYCVTGHCNHVTNTSNTRGFLQSKTTNRTTSSIRVVTVGDGGTILDFEVIDIALFI